jgi:hypothetical protein
MKCIQYIHVSKSYENELLDWKGFISYESEDVKLGKVIAFKLIEDTEKYNQLIKYLNIHKIEYLIFRKDYKFNKKDIENAQIYYLHLYKSIEQYYDDFTERESCMKCHKKIKTFRKKVYLDKKIITRFDIFTHYFGREEIIVSEKLKNIFEKEKVAGASFEPFLGENEGYYHLKLEETKMDLAEQSFSVKDGYCEVCKRHDTLLIYPLLYFNKNLYDNLDIFYTKEWLGDGKSEQGKVIIISKKLYMILKQNSISNAEWSVHPAFLI